MCQAQQSCVKRKLVGYDHNGVFFNSYLLFTYLFIYLFIYYLFKVDKLTKAQYTYIHKNSQTNWLIKCNYPVLQKKLIR